MGWVNFILAVNDDTWQRLRDNFRLVDPENPSQGYVHNDLTNAERRAMRGAFAGHWKSPTLAGTVYHGISFYVQDELDRNGKLKFVEYLPNKWPNKFHIIGCWNPDGSQYGTTIVPARYELDQNGDVIEVEPEQVTGTPMYPVHAQALKLMPDDVVYNENGQEVSRTPATEFKEVHRLAGWKERRWT